MANFSMATSETYKDKTTGDRKEITEWHNIVLWHSLAAQASSNAALGSQEVEKAVSTMQALLQGSGKMAEIVGVINSIAFQTNILALNAAVEAARAGPHGRGFAVVAAEVRSLAQRSATSAKEVEQLIRLSVEQTGTGSQLVNNAGAAMQQIVRSVQKVSDFMGEIAIASGQQASGIEQITLTVMQMDTITQQNAALVQEAASATLSQHGQVSALELALDQFTLESSCPDERADCAAPELQPKQVKPLLVKDNRYAPNLSLSMQSPT